MCICIQDTTYNIFNFKWVNKELKLNYMYDNKTI